MLQCRVSFKFMVRKQIYVYLRCRHPRCQSFLNYKQVGGSLTLVKHCC